jgi:FtsP/CotA-like multicopper oxidase with cupredoxin domain
MRTKLIILFFFGALGFSFAQTTINYQVILRSNMGSHTLWDSTVVPIYGFAPTLSQQPTLPALTLYANEGDTVIITARSVSQGEHHTIHLHGLDVDTRNDGDPSTSFWLEHMQDTTYTFVAKNAGTYLYHCHVGDVVHVQMGMYGLIVVKAAGGVKTAWTGGPAFDKDYKWLMSELDWDWHDDPPMHDPNTDQVYLPPYIPEYFLINGKSRQQLATDDSIKINGAQGEVIYLRLANIGFYDNKVVFPAALNAKVIDSDGRPLPSMIVSDTVWVSPGERFGVLLQANSQFIDSVAVNYVNMNTQQTWDTEYVLVTISGFIGMEDKEPDAGFDIFPNPAHEYIEVVTDDAPIEEISIHNALGQMILQQDVHNHAQRVRMSVSSLLAGIYYVSVKGISHNQMKKIVISK